MLYVFAGLLAAAVIGLDQLVKYLVVASIAPGAQAALIPGLVRLTYVKNTGAAFSILTGHRWPLAVITLAVVALIVFALARRYVTHPFGVLTLAAVTGGALGNLIDRLRLGYVVDMFEFEFVRFPVFNVADIFLTCGAVLLCVYIIFFYSRDEAKRLERNRHDDSV